MMQENKKNMNETLAHGYSSEKTQWELSNEYQQSCFYLQDFTTIVRLFLAAVGIDRLSY